MINQLLTISYYLQEMSMSGIEAPTLESFVDSIHDFTIQEKYFKWEAYLQTLKQASSQFYPAILEKFLEYFPFNHTYWSELCELAAKVPKTGKANAVRLYQLALVKNPRSISLWKSYLSWLVKEICKSDPAYLKKQYEKATKIIGNHYHASCIFERYFELEQSPVRKYQCMKKALVSPLKQIDRVYDTIAAYIDTSPNLTVEVLKQLAQEQNLTVIAHDAATFQKEVRELLKLEMRKLYEPSKKHVEMRYEFEHRLSPLDEYRPYSGNIEVWRGYLALIKASGNHDFLPPLYQRALITNCDNEALWEDYFMLLENEGNQNRSLYLLRLHGTFFRNFSKEITYNWLELEERENHNRSRELCVQLQKSDPNLDIFTRHIQMELRYKEFQNARVIYETILTTFTANVNIVAFMVIEYAEFALKYFRDIDAKKMLRNYFDSYPFNEDLFLGLLQFYIKHVEFKEGTKQGKQIYDQFVGIMVSGLKRALENDSERYRHISKVARKYMRVYVTSIFLIKGAERKVKEVEMQVKREADLVSKRIMPQEERSQPQEKLSLFSPGKYRLQ